MPKLLVSTMATRDAAAFVGTRDITLMHSVTDIAGLNRFSRRILRNAARAAAGMATAEPETGAADRPLIALTMFGVTTPGLRRAEERLRDSGFDTIVFHAVGTGGRAMERMIEDKLVPDIRVREEMLNINDRDFADIVADLFLALWAERRAGTGRLPA